MLISSTRAVPGFSFDSGPYVGRVVYYFPVRSRLCNILSTVLWPSMQVREGNSGVTCRRVTCSMCPERVISVVPFACLQKCCHLPPCHGIPKGYHHNVSVVIRGGSTTTSLLSKILVVVGLPHLTVCLALSCSGSFPH